MHVQNRKGLIVVAAALLLLASIFHGPRADIRILAHDPADTAPRKVQAAVDMGLFAVTLLVTWTSRQIAR